MSTTPQPPAPIQPLAALDEWTDEFHVALADLSYEGENSRLVCPIKARAGVALTAEQRAVNALVSALSRLLRWSYFTRTQPNNMINALLGKAPSRRRGSHRCT